MTVDPLTIAALACLFAVALWFGVAAERAASDREEFIP